METSNPNLLSAAYKAARRTDEKSLVTLCEYWRTSQVEYALDGNEYTILHFIAFYGNSVAIKRLRDEQLLTMKQLRDIRDMNGDTALHVAARFGRLGVVKEILNGEENFDSLINSVNNSEDTPIYVAAACGKIKVFDFLTDIAPREHVTEMQRTDERTVLHVAVEGQFFVLAFRISETYPELAHRPTQMGKTPLYMLACNKTAFRSGTMYNLTNLSSSPFIPWRIVTILFYYLCFTPLRVRNSQTTGSIILAGYRRLTKGFSKILNKRLSYSPYCSLFKLNEAIPFIKEAYEAREKHVYAYALSQKLVKTQQQWPCHEPRKDSPPDPLIKAVRNSIMELVRLILDKFPEASTAVDKNKRNILLVAAKTKDAFMYEYLKRKVPDQQKLLSEVDCYGNTALHLASERWELSKNTYSPLVGMSWDVFWYQHVKEDIQRPLILYRNLENLTAKDVFKNGHIREPKEASRTPKEIFTNIHIKKPEEAQGNPTKVLTEDNTLLIVAEALENATKSKETMLIKVAEEDAKKVNEGLMLVSVLISTINFAAIFTIPGGFSQEEGIPFFYKKRHTTKSKELDYFLLYIGVSLLSSLIALGTQLSIHLSRFRKIDFYFVLPTKMFIATTALYYATTFSITACFQAYILEEAVAGNSLSIFFGMMVACVPAALVYFDLVYYIMNYLYFPIWYKFLAPPRQVINSFLFIMMKSKEKI